MSGLQTKVVSRSAYVETMVDTMMRLAQEANAAAWCVVETFPFLKGPHWSAYAKEAGLLDPTPGLVEEITAAYKRRIGYREPAETQRPKG